MSVPDFKTNLYGFLYAAQFAVLDDGKISSTELDYLKALASKMGIHWMNHDLIESIASDQQFAYGRILLSRLNSEDERLYFLFLLIQSFVSDQVSNRAEQGTIGRVIDELGWKNFEVRQLSQKLEVLRPKNVSCKSFARQNRLQALMYLMLFNTVDGNFGVHENEYFKKQIQFSEISLLQSEEISEALFSFGNLFIEFENRMTSEFEKLLREDLLYQMQKHLGSNDKFIAPIVSGLIFASSNKVDLLTDTRISKLLALLPGDHGLSLHSLKEMLFIYSVDKSAANPNGSKMKMRDLVLSFKFLISSPNLKEKDEMLKAVRSIPLPKVLTLSQAESLKTTIEHALNLQSRNYEDSLELFREMKKIIDFRTVHESTQDTLTSAKTTPKAIDRSDVAASLKVDKKFNQIWISDSDLNQLNSSQPMEDVYFASAKAIKDLLK